jgi:hypothetical protein
MWNVNMKPGYWNQTIFLVPLAENPVCILIVIPSLFTAVITNNNGYLLRKAIHIYVEIIIRTSTGNKPYCGFPCFNVNNQDEVNL